MILCHRNSSTESENHLNDSVCGKITVLHSKIFLAADVSYFPPLAPLKSLEVNQTEKESTNLNLLEEFASPWGLNKVESLAVMRV